MRHPRLALVVADAQHRRDVRVAEGAGGLRVAPEARDGRARVPRGGGEELHRHGPVVLGLPRDVDDAERAAAELAADLERPERLRLVHWLSRGRFYAPREGAVHTGACYRARTASW